MNDLDNNNDITRINSNLVEINLRYTNPIQEYLNNKNNVSENISNNLPVTDYVKVSTVENTKTLMIKVELKRATANEAQYFKSYLLTFVQPNNNKFIIDFSTSEFIDSTFLGAIVFIYKKISSLEGKLILVMNTKETVLTTAIDSLSKIFKIYPTLELALKEAA